MESFKPSFIHLLTNYTHSVHILSYFSNFVSARKLMISLCRSTYKSWNTNTQEFSFFINTTLKMMTYDGEDIEGFLEFISEGEKYVEYSMQLKERVKDVKIIIDFLTKISKPSMVRFHNLAVVKDDNFWQNMNKLYLALESKGVSGQCLTDVFFEDNIVS